jgi:hypothetical protein
MKAARFILICLAGWMNRNQQDAIEYLREEVRVMKEHLGFCQIILCGDVRVVIGIVGPKKETKNEHASH